MLIDIWKNDNYDKIKEIKKSQKLKATKKKQRNFLKKLYIEQ